MSEPRKDETSTPQQPPQGAQPDGQPTERVPVLFAPKGVEEPRRGWLLWGGLGVLAVVLVAVVFAMRGHQPETRVDANQILPIARYATQLAVSQLTMSQSTSLSGGTSTYIDGHIRNTGTRTLTGVTVQVLFPNDEGQAPQLQTLPLSLIRSREPYVDTEPLSAAPLKPGDEKEFRLIFENISKNWNQQIPEIHIVKVEAQ